MFQMERQHSAVEHCSVSLLNGLYVVYCSGLNNLKKDHAVCLPMLCISLSTAVI